MSHFADLIIRGASVFPGLTLPEDYDYLTVKGSHIQSMGRGDSWKFYAGPDTEVLEFSKDRLVIPGFHDAHIHLLLSALQYRYVSLFDARSEEEAAQMTARFAKAHPDDPWVIGLNWHHMNWDSKKLPTKESLDRLIPDRPVFLPDNEVHGAWVNSKALEIIGIGKNTPDPKSGEIYRDENGEATGYLNESALALAAVHAFNFDTDTEKNLISLALDRFISYGITSIQDLCPELGYRLCHFDAYHQLARENGMKARVHCAADLLDPIEETMQQRRDFNSSVFQIALLKQYMDGVPTTHTAMTLEPYRDAPDLTVPPIHDLDIMAQQIEEAHRNGLSVKVHCCGDGAVKQTLDLYEKAIKKYGETAARHSIEHMEIVSPDDLLRMKKYHIIASMQPEHVGMQVDRYEDNPYIGKYSPAQLETLWCFRSVLDRGITLAFGSDCPIAPENPLLGIYRAVTRLFDDRLPEGGMNPEQKLSVREALHCYTFNPAAGVHREHELGTLEPGKLADIAVLDKNILKTDPEEIKETRVLLTIMDGKIRYRRRGE